MFWFNSKKRELERKVEELEDEVSNLLNDLIHDTLTGLKTRAYFEEEVGVYLKIIEGQAEAAQYAESPRKENFGFKNLSIVFLDIDHFKKVNDKYGHDIGDVVLKSVAAAVRDGLRTEDTAARWGGEEIVVSLLGATEKEAMIKAERIRKKIEKLKFREAPGLSVTVSAGVAGCETGVGVVDLEKRADEALYKAKKTGRNKVVAYSQIKENN